MELDHIHMYTVGVYDLKSLNNELPSVFEIGLKMYRFTRQSFMGLLVVNRAFVQRIFTNITPMTLYMKIIVFTLGG